MKNLLLILLTFVALVSCKQENIEVSNTTWTFNEFNRITTIEFSNDSVVFETYLDSVKINELKGIYYSDEKIVYIQFNRIPYQDPKIEFGNKVVIFWGSIVNELIQVK